jgi:hypothetical protein
MANPRSSHATSPGFARSATDLALEPCSLHVTDADSGQKTPMGSRPSRSTLPSNDTLRPSQNDPGARAPSSPPATVRLGGRWSTPGHKSGRGQGRDVYPEGDIHLVRRTNPNTKPPLRTVGCTQ